MKGNHGKHGPQLSGRRIPAPPSGKVNVTRNLGGRGVNDITELGIEARKPPATPKAKTPDPRPEGFTY